MATSTALMEEEKPVEISEDIVTDESALLNSMLSSERERHPTDTISQSTSEDGRVTTVEVPRDSAIVAKSVEKSSALATSEAVDSSLLMPNETPSLLSAESIAVELDMAVVQKTEDAIIQETMSFSSTSRDESALHHMIHLHRRWREI
jgi:hypothetical protein